MSDEPQVALNDEPMCDHICLLREGHVEEGRPHFYGYRLGPGSPSWLLAEVERLTQERDTARDIATALEQQNAEALRLVKETLDRAPGFGEWVFMDYLRDIALLLGDDETETNQ